MLSVTGGREPLSGPATRHDAPRPLSLLRVARGRGLGQGPWSESEKLQEESRLTDEAASDFGTSRITGPWPGFARPIAERTNLTAALGIGSHRNRVSQDSTPVRFSRPPPPFGSSEMPSASGATTPSVPFIGDADLKRIWRTGRRPLRYPSARYTTERKGWRSFPGWEPNHQSRAHQTGAGTGADFSRRPACHI
jgi:hypothetical protein